jgi:hypothetical protein
MDTGVAIAEYGPIPKPVTATVNDPEAQFLHKTERFPYLRSPLVGLWNLTRRHALIHDSDCDSNVGR